MNTGRSETAVIKQPDQTGRRRQNTDIAALTDGRFIAALFVLIANDHWLKAEYGNWLTGKASDIAGLIMLPVVVVSALRLARLRPNTSSVLAIVGGWFTAMKLWAPAAAATELLAETITGVEHRIIVDPTDLIGLIGLAIAARIIAAPRPLITARIVRFALLTLGLAATVATSNSYEEPATDLITERATGEVTAIVVPYGFDSTREQCRSLPEPADDFDAETNLVDDAGRGGSHDLEYFREEVEECERAVAGQLDVGFALESCPELSTFACVRGNGAAIDVSIDGSSWTTEWALDRSSPTSHGTLPEYDYSYDPMVQDLVVDRWGTTHVTFRSGLYLTRSEDGEWSRPFSDFRPITFVALAAAVATALSAVAVAFRRARSERWWMVPLIAVAGYVSIVMGFYSEDLLIPVGQMGGFGLFTLALFLLLVIVGRYRLEIPGFGANVGLAVASAIVVFLPFVVWKYRVGMSFHWTWAWLVVAAGCGFAIDALIGRRIAALPTPPPPKPSDNSLAKS